MFSRPADFSVANYQATAQQTTPVTAEDTGPDTSTTTSGIPFEAEILAELDPNSTQNGNFSVEGIDWEALMNDGQLWNSIGGSWSGGFTEDELLKS
jgi:hypothetical protein